MAFDNEIVDRIKIIDKNNRGDKIIIEAIYDSEEDRSNHIIKAIDVRQYFTGNEENLLIPTKKGLRIPFRNLDDVVEALKSLQSNEEE